MNIINKSIRYTLVLAWMIGVQLSVIAQDIEANGIYYTIIGDAEVAVSPAWDNESSLYQGVIILPEWVHCDGINYRVTTIGARAFWQSPITEIQIPNSVTHIGEAAFAQTSELTSVTLPLGLTQISNNLFAGSALSNIVIPEGVTRIGARAFEDCNQLHTVFLPYSLKSVGARSFGDCFNLFEIYCAASTPPITEPSAFAGVSGADVVFADGKTASAYSNSLEWGNDETFSLWYDESLSAAPTETRQEAFENDWISVSLGDNMAYRIYGEDGYLLAVTAAEHYYFPIGERAENYLIVPSNLIADNEEGQLAVTIEQPAAIQELTDPQPQPRIFAYDGTIYILGDTHGMWTRIYDVYGNLWYERPSVTNWITNLPGGRLYIVCVGNVTRKVYL